MPQLPLILFDIDGTLLRSGDRTHSYSVRLACQEFFQIAADTPIPAEVDLAGRTDRRILVTLLAAHGIPLERSEPRLPEMFAFMEEYVASRVPSLIEWVLPGVPDLLAALAARDLTQGLVTGNLPRIAEAKLAAAGLWKPFARADGVIGGFGHASVERDDLPPIALDLAGKALGRPIPGTDAVLIGDTPHDIACARACGARIIAVATGRFSPDALRPYNPDLLVADLTDTAALLRFIGNEG